METYYLKHHGVKGMKWGVRKDRKRFKRSRAERDADKEARQKMKLDAENRRLLSDEELDRKISRIKKEKELKKLTDEEVSPGKTIAKGILIAGGTAAATTIVAGTIKYGVKVAMTKKFDMEEAAGFIVPKPKK